MRYHGNLIKSAFSGTGVLLPAYTEHQEEVLSWIPIKSREAAESTEQSVLPEQKNALLPLLAASVLGKGESVLHNCPALSDVYAMLGILEAAGCRTEFSDGNIRICPDGMKETFLHGDLVKQMRSSVFLLGPVLALKGSVCMGFPGGCAIGRRPVDIHLSALRKMGADIEEREETIICRCERLHGAVIRLPFPSVGATENIMMAAALADGITVIRNAAREPEIEELQNFMNKMGAEICGAGTSVIIIAGKKRLSGAEWNVMSDRIEAGTLILAAAVTGGRIFVKNVRAEYMEAFLSLYGGVRNENRCSAGRNRSRGSAQTEGCRKGADRPLSGLSDGSAVSASCGHDDC